MFGNIKKW